MPIALDRNEVQFACGADQRAAGHYTGANGTCAVMAGGFAVNNEPATDRFAAGSPFAPPPRGELAEVPGGHYAPFMDAHEQAVEIQLAFLVRSLLSS